jgi:septum formation protein
VTAGLTPIVLASQSASRAAILISAGVPFEQLASGFDEETAKARLLADNADPREIACRLAEAKAVDVSAARPGAIVVGADTTLDLDGGLIDKAASLPEARDKLARLRGRPHLLHSAVVAAEDGVPLWRAVESPRLVMRDFSDRYLEGYLLRGGEALLGSVGCYHLEGEGAQLFERIEGDYFAILGLPLLPLLRFLRDKGAIAA